MYLFLLLNGQEDAAISQSDRLPAQKKAAELSTVWIEVKMCRTKMMGMYEMR